MKQKALLVVPIFLLILSLSLRAQITSSSISGQVKDQSNELVTGASVVLTHLSTGTVYKTITTAAGTFHLGNLSPGGPYLLKVAFIGYQPEERSNIYLTLGVNQRFDIVLKTQTKELGEVKITATKGAPKVGTGERVATEEAQKIASLSRSLQDLTRLTPQSNNNSFLGSNFRYNNVTIDGAINNDAIGFSPSLGGQTNTSGQPGSSTRTNPVSLDAIQDVQVYLAPYDVKIGNFVGGSVNAVTRAGTNTIHGSVYGYGRASFLIGPNNAGDKAPLPSDFHDYQTGFRLGLPLIKNKLFLFTNEELTRRLDPVILAAGSPQIAKVIDLPTAQALTNYLESKFQIDPKSDQNTSIFSRSNKFFNRLDWNINDKNQLTIRNNTVLSKATNLERDQQNFRFSSIDFTQINNQNSTVAELKSRGNSFSNSLVLGYSSIHDYRVPGSNPSLPQVQIAGLSTGTIFLGTDREASIFDMKQKTFEFTDNFTFYKGKHTFLVGTHNEFYRIQYGFVNSWNGRIDYNSVSDFLSNLPSRVRGNFNYVNNSRDYILTHPSALFNVNMFSLYLQDEIQLSSRLKIVPGIRFDLPDVPNKQPLSTKTTSSPVDPNYGTTYTYTLPKDIHNKYLGQVQVSPRFGFNYDAFGDSRLVFRGGSGIFTGRIPFAWLGYAFYNNGNTFGAYDQKASPAKPFIGDPLTTSANGIADFAKLNGVAVNDPSTPTQVDLIDNNFKMPKVWRSSLGIDYTTENKFKFTLEGIYTSVIKDLKFQQLNLLDNPIYYPYDVNHQQPIYPSGKINPSFTNAYLLSNTNKGYRYSLTAQASKSFEFGLDLMAAYTYGQSKDITNGIRNSMESNWQLNQALSPNSPTLAFSNFDVRHRIFSVLNYKINWDKRHTTNFSFFLNAQSGSPFTYGFLNATIQNTPQQVSLAYIPKVGETLRFFGDLVDGAGNVTATAAQQAAAFDAFIDNDPYLRTRRGNFTQRNGGRTPWNTQLDFRLTHDFQIPAHKNTLTLTFDIVNLTNLLNAKWGRAYFSPNTFNSTASVGLKLRTAGTGTTYPTYTFTNPGVPYAIDFFNSRYQMQFGLRYSF
ncbi:MAG TPA: carboxypeptidase regulatory-like domain-containing protein [Daejeonella sp.]|nr:carboxypeptidase regulatory-like domain-containing protein [Daejeonella sp.]